ncbi:MAG: hypothetical protein KatS3mg085_687 [Candidatus Dojkabacteria bacterium]|nr:MAG: hypothetical protein KatS3mg085_687 [Candidatus Dojkabacteria bacterium]
MSKKIKIRVKGMHCNACKMLIRVELEEMDLEENIEKIELEANNQGVIVLKNMDEHDIRKIIDKINKTELYEVI